MKNIFLATVNDTMLSVKRHKNLFLFLLLLQILFFTSFGYSSFKTIPPVVDALKESMEYINGLDLTEEALARSLLSIDKSFLGDDPLLIHQSLIIIQTYGTIFLFVSLFIFLVFEGSNWVLVNHEHAKAKTFVLGMRNFVILSLIYFLLIAFLAISTPIADVLGGGISLISVFSLFLIFMLFYFMVISFSLIKGKSIWGIIKKSFLIGMYKAYILLPVLFFNIILVAGTLFLFYKVSDTSSIPLELNLFLMLITGLFFTFTYVLTKIFFVKLIRKIS